MAQLRSARAHSDRRPLCKHSNRQLVQKFMFDKRVVDVGLFLGWSDPLGHNSRSCSQLLVLVDATIIIDSLFRTFTTHSQHQVKRAIRIKQKGGWLRDKRRPLYFFSIRKVKVKVCSLTEGTKLAYTHTSHARHDLFITTRP